MSELESEIKEIKNMVADLIWISGVIATELIQITENTSRALRGDIPESCRIEHKRLREKIIELVKKNCPRDIELISSHVLKHKGD
jgi:hypothetical protein